MRIAIVDDEAAVRETLQGYIGRMADEQGLPLETAAFPSGDALLADYQPVYDILIFDIDMPGTSGLDTARRIRAQDEQVVILFITQMAQYAINGYEVDAVDYIIKPIGYYDFALKFQRAMRRAGQRKPQGLVLDTVDGPASLPVEDILYVEVMAHYVIYHTAAAAYRVRASMKEHEQALKAYHFARCHKSYLINLQHLRHVGAADVLVGELSIPLGRAYKDALLQAYMNYLHR